MTGGTGSLGRAFIERMLKEDAGLKKLLVFSRDELKQFRMRQEFPEKEYPALQFMLGDVRDRERVLEACEGIDLVVHVAVLKHAPLAEANPMEFVKTNIQGTENVVKAALQQGVKKMIAISTDKAVAPEGVYGATKLCAESIVLEANRKKGTILTVLRLPNLLGSSGSVAEISKVRKALRSYPLPILMPIGILFPLNNQSTCSC